MVLTQKNPSTIFLFDRNINDIIGFVGKEAVALMVQSGMASTREEAVQLGREWMAGQNLFEHVLRRLDFEDDVIFYRFVQKRNRFPSLTRNSSVFAMGAYDLGIYLEDSSTTSSSNDSVSNSLSQKAPVSSPSSSVS